ncbi:hypothetical protein [Undibacterium sp.]|uniref:hypothetical protein n=1 Tax=Undibacterium sp. TaxID=1914977 RepID=UPI00374D5A29
MSDDNDDIQLSGPFKAVDASGKNHDVKGIRIFDEGYGIIDVYVDFAAALGQGKLYADKVLVGHILAKLRALGYVGPDFGHGDLGLQDEKLIVLEAPEEFNAFAASKGWKNLAEEFEDEPAADVDSDTGTASNGNSGSSGSSSNSGAPASGNQLDALMRKFKS